jgi:molecular chaperone GrpE
MAGKKKSTDQEISQKIDSLEAKLKRALADYDNLEKRVLARRAQLVNSARIEILDKLIGALDDLERAEEHLKNRGLTMAMNQFRAVLKSEGVEEIKALGEEFDPQLMDCAAMVKGEKNKVIEVTQKGYQLNGQVIRPAEVEVGSGKNNKK